MKTRVTGHFRCKLYFLHFYTWQWAGETGDKGKIYTFSFKYTYILEICLYLWLYKILTGEAGAVADHGEKV